MVKSNVEYCPKGLKGFCFLESLIFPLRNSLKHLYLNWIHVCFSSLLKVILINLLRNMWSSLQIPWLNKTFCSSQCEKKCTKDAEFSTNHSSWTFYRLCWNVEINPGFFSVDMLRRRFALVLLNKEFMLVTKKSLFCECGFLCFCFCFSQSRN